MKAAIKTSTMAFTALMIVGAVWIGQFAQAVRVDVTVPETVILDINGSEMDNLILGTSSEASDSSVIINGRLFSSNDWVIAGPVDPIYMSDGDRTLRSPLSVSISPASGNPGLTDLTTTYSQLFTELDEPGDYNARVAWIASVSF